jgi:Tfp pilus assembly protein PilE
VTTKEKTILGGIAVAVLLLIGLLAWRSEVERSADQAALKSTLSTLGTQIAQRTQTAATADKQVDQQVAQAKSPDQQAALIAALVGMKQAPTIVTIPVQAPAASSGVLPVATSNVGAKQEVKPLPDAPQPGDMVIPKVDIPQFVAHEATCKKDGIDLASCTANLSDTAKERDAAVTANKGGSLLARIKRNGKWTALGIVIGTAAGATLAAIAHK